MSVHEEWLKSLKTFSQDLTLPPPSLKELGLEYLEIRPGEFMVAKLPFQEKFTNPVGIYQGGFLTAAVDEVMGPLSYLTAQSPCMTLSLNMTFLRPFTKEMSFCLIKASILSDSNNFIFLRAEITSPNGKLIAHAESHVTKVKP